MFVDKILVPSILGCVSWCVLHTSKFPSFINRELTTLPGHSLKVTAPTSKMMGLEDEPFCLGFGLFPGAIAVSFRKCSYGTKVIQINLGTKLLYTSKPNKGIWSAYIKKHIWNEEKEKDTGLPSESPETFPWISDLIGDPFIIWKYHQDAQRIGCP